jgi:EAL domain-containing protein (putative c-di-GMP-specific phosphodiesterase class I)
MGILVVAEGVETLPEREMLVQLGCNLFQGYLIAKPGRPFPTPKW